MTYYKNNVKLSLRDVITYDLPASLVTFLVALPLSLGIALASGAPLMAGIIAAIIGGIVVGPLAGAPMQVSGPAAGLTVLVFGFVQQFGWGVTCAMTVSAGILQLLLGAKGAATLAMAVSPAVIHGMLAAIGILIALSQIHIVLGLDAAGTGPANLFAIPVSVLNLHPEATILGLITIGILVAWPKLSFRLLRKVPASLMAVGAATVVSVVFSMDVPRVDLAGNLFESISLPALPSENFAGVAMGILALTLVTSAQSLLCAVATDKLHTGSRCKLDRELVTLGAGNAVSGLLGGLPLAGVIVRSKVSISAGAKTRYAAIMHGVWILVFVALLPGVVMLIPLSVLAGLLVYIGIQLVNRHHIYELRKCQEILVYSVTVVSIVSIDMLKGLAIGFGVALARLLWKLLYVDIIIKENDNEKWHVTISGTLTFLGVPKLTRQLATIPPGGEVEMSLNLSYLDHAGCEALHSWQETYEKMEGRVRPKEASGYRFCERSPLVDCSIFSGAAACNQEMNQEMKSDIEHGEFDSLEESS